MSQRCGAGAVTLVTAGIILALGGSASAERHSPTPAVTPSRPLPRWPYNESRFPAAWFGAQPLRFENATEVAALGKYSLVLFGWQALQLFENYTDVMQAQVQLSLSRARARARSLRVCARARVCVYTASQGSCFPG